MWSKFAKIAFLCILIALTAKHYHHLFVSNAPLMIDYIKFFAASHAIAHGLDPYDIHNLVYSNSALVPYIFPGMVLPFIPFVLMGLEAGGYVFMLLNMLICPVMLYFMIKKLHLPFSLSILNPHRETLVTFIAFYLFLNCYPTLTAIGSGQLGILVSLFMVLSLFSKDRMAALYLALAAALKYSLAPPVAIVYFIKQNYRTCVYTLVFFLLLAPQSALFWIKHPRALFTLSHGVYNLRRNRRI